MSWDPRQYARFARERERPFFDLLSAIPPIEPESVVDLGCGAGNLTRLLAETWPRATVLGVDSSVEMLERAAGERAANLTFTRADVRDWRPDAPVDLVFSNATLQWVEDHPNLIPRLAASTARVLAVQMPGNHEAPSHREIAALALTPRWEAKLGSLGRRRANVLALSDYVERLVDCGFAVEAWETTYLHQLAGENAVLEWIKGTFLRPFLAALDEREQGAFLEEAGERLRAAYPSRDGRTLFPFRRIFFVGTR
ncbi:MAG: methyltransferase domain-containing protein [Candidatus Eisenbacteria bacterium]